MKIIQESPEHHFLTVLEKLKADSAGWLGYRFALSRKMKHTELIAKPEHIKGKLHTMQQESDELIKEIGQQLKDDSTAMLYQFADSEVILLRRVGNDAEREKAQQFFAGLESKIGSKISESHNLSKDLYTYQKLADARFLSAKKMRAYQAMADSNRVASIPLRRDRHDDGVIMIVEDDRFTASYAANILNKDYDVVLAKTGEEAIAFHIEHAPDMVFLDIHLPGLDGLDTLRAIRKVDPQSFIFMLSVDTVKQNIVEAQNEGAAGFLKKPFGKERLQAAVDKSPFINAIKKKK